MKPESQLPIIIQGGMGAAVSNWHLANTVARQGQLGVISGTGLDTVIARRLQTGDPGGHCRRALKAFPFPEMADRIMDRFYIEGGKDPGQPFKLIPMPVINSTQASLELLIVSNFIEVWLAKEGHDGLVGLNLLEKIQLPTSPSLFGAMLADVDVVLMGAGIPLNIPGILDKLAVWEAVDLPLDVKGAPNDSKIVHHFDPNAVCPVEGRPELNRPMFFPIVSSDIVAKSMIRRGTGSVEGFVVENYTAGGHNAPPRRVKGQTSPEFSEKDDPNLQNIRELGKPFWLAGSYAAPEKLQEAIETGAKGLQLGTIFGYCNESGILTEIKQEVVKNYLNNGLKVITDFKASPTGYPFKLVEVEQTESGINRPRLNKRICDLGYLRTLFTNDKDEVAYRCPAEPVDAYVKKGGTEEETEGRRCLCNGLMSTIGLGQVRGEVVELPIVTSGQDFSFLKFVLREGETSYSVADALNYLLSGIAVR